MSRRILKHVLHICVIMAILTALCGCGKEVQPHIDEAENEQTEAVTGDPSDLDNEEDLPKTVLIETSVCQILFPEDAYDVLVYDEHSQAGEVMGIFYAANGESKQEVFRLIFSPIEQQNAVGFLKIPNGDLFVSISVCDYRDEDFSDDNAKENYYTIVSAINTVLESIYADERFCKIDEYNAQNFAAEFAYWSVELPENVVWEEEFLDENYMVTFYGDIGDKRVKLYSVSIGNKLLGSQIGFYSVDEQWNPVTVESYPFSLDKGWTDSQIAELQTLMSTINDVLQAITSSEFYSERTPE